MTQDEILQIDEARNIAVTFGTRMCDEHGDAHGEELYCVGIDDIIGIIKQVTAKEREACAKVCDARYMGDNNREDMEAKRCAKAIRARSES